jgi:hypothetical protein
VRENGDATPEAARVNLIRFSWFNGASLVTLWDIGAATPESERWLRLVVGLSETLIGRVIDWAAARDALGSGPRPDQLSALNARADALVADLNADLPLRFRAHHVH